MRPISPKLKSILTQVSRSFSLSIAVLPASLRQPIGVAYLVARAADTVADTRIVPQAERLRLLDALRRTLDPRDPAPLPALEVLSTGPQCVPGERALLLALPEVLQALRELSVPDRERVAAVVATLIAGMEADLRTFPGEDARGLSALQTRLDLDRYTYFAAGCVGEFWTDMALAHRAALRRWDPERMRGLGKRFGQALQMTNVLRDLPQDVRIGRCYLPEQDLRSIGLAPPDLLDPSALRRLRPLLCDLLRLTLTHYADGWAYTLAIPRTEMRMRLACLWPMLIGLQTLEALAGATALLDPGVRVKIPRAAVRRILTRSTLRVGSNTLLEADYRRLRGRVLAGLAP